jgi:hypothetical protein
MTQAEKETIETFCRELALALRRITGKTIDIDPEMLAVPEEFIQQAESTPVSFAEMAVR